MFFCILDTKNWFSVGTYCKKNQNHYGSFIYYRNVPKSNLYDSGINGTPLNFLYTDYKEAGQQVQPDRRTQLMRKYMILHCQKMNLSFLRNNKKCRKEISCSRVVLYFLEVTAWIGVIKATKILFTLDLFLIKENYHVVEANLSY